MYPFVDTVSHH